jgi:chemotaxis protein methyltransferase CheR
MEIELKLIVDAIFLKYHYDFRNYSAASLHRRLEQALPRFECPTISRLQDRILREPAAFSELLNYLTVQVSEMFRDPPYFRGLRESVVPILKTYPSLKVWVAGCGHGQELHSLAILFHEEDLLKRTIFYATDINAEALRAAKSGIYPIEAMAGFSRNYLESGGKTSLSHYYTAAHGGAVFDRALRSQVVFSDHSLATDTVFSEVHLVSCRNVMIYFDRELQDRAIGLFRDALVHGGFLGLGATESLPPPTHSDGFTDFLRDERIYRRGVIHGPRASGGRLHGS